MPLDAVPDVQLAAVATLAKGAVNADLASFLAADEVAINGLYAHPIPLDRIQSAVLPALAVWRAGSVEGDFGNEEYQDAVTLRLDYYMPATGHDKLDARWSFLTAVWKKMWGTLRVGSHPSVSAGAEVLVSAGVYAQLGTARVRFNYAPGRGKHFPAFQATMVFDMTTDIPAAVTAFADLETFNRLDVDWQLEEGIAGDTHAEDRVVIPQQTPDLPYPGAPDDP